MISRNKYITGRKIIFLFLIVLAFSGCTKTGSDIDTPDNLTKHLVIFFINDQHSQIDNFSRIKYIVDKEKENSSVILACSGDIFSGNPIVDKYDPKGYPIIDIMNIAGFDISAVGNHEYDYGESVLKDRMEQADFKWVCANVDMNDTGVPEPFEYTTISKDDINITFLGLVETDGKQDGTIPSTHPWKVKNYTFQRPEDVMYKYSNVKEKENSDLYIALSHLGFDKGHDRLGDVQLAKQFPYFDLIIGGHSHLKIDTTINGIPIFQAGSYLKYMGRIELFIKDRSIDSLHYSLIDLKTVNQYDQNLKEIIDKYDEAPFLDEVVGYSVRNHNKDQVGCFYTDALRIKMNVDVSFQNKGGIRSGLDKGDITLKDIYEIDPFGNGSIIYNMTVYQLKNFLKESKSGFYYSGIHIEQTGSNIKIKDLQNNILDDSKVLSVGCNDYIAATNDYLFPNNGIAQALSATETIIAYLKEINSQVDYSNCGNYFKYK